MITTRDQIIHAACDLVENQGCHATGLNDIVKVSGAPKGSIYYYFPGGKEEIIADAVLYAGRALAERIQTELASIEEPAEAIKTFIENVAHHVEASGFHAGGPLTNVASETATTSERLNMGCRAAYDLLLAAFKAKLLSSGMDEERAAELAVFITASIEGGVILSRTYHNGDPLRTVASIMHNCMVHLLPTGSKQT